MGSFVDAEVEALVLFVLEGLPVVSQPFSVPGTQPFLTVDYHSISLPPKFLIL